MEKIKMNPIAELDGDEMTRILWQAIKDELICPFVDLKTEYYDLSLPNRDRTDDTITVEAAEAIARLGVGVKCATITPNRQRVEEYGLKKMWKSPNATIRAYLDGTVFRAPIMTGTIKPYIPTWKKPITIARHAYGDIYKAVEYQVPGPGKAELVFIGTDGTEQYRETVYDFTGPGLLQAQHNKEDSIAFFARNCFDYALATGQDLWFSAKDTISKQYDQRFKLIFEELYKNEYQQKFEKAGISYFYTLIDDAVARAVRSEGGFIWALKNYDGDVMSDMVSTAFGSLAMMTSVLVSPTGAYEYEAAHGTITRHYYAHREGKTTSSNSIATIFAWTGALSRRAQLDGNTPLAAFATALEKACMDTVDSGTVTKDLALLLGESHPWVDSFSFLKAIRTNLEKVLA